MLEIQRVHTIWEAPLTTHTLTAAESAAKVVGDYFREPLGALLDWRTDISADIQNARSIKPLTASRLDDIVAPYATRTFDVSVAPVYGAGFIAALDLLSDAHGHLAWWQGSERKKLVLAAQSLSKEQIDYSSLEWYRVPMLTAKPHVAGPYVDYLCSDEYTITVAVPVHIGDEFVGVAGLDLLVDSVEVELTPALAALGIVTIVNGVGRVVISTDPRRATGDSMRGDAVAGLERVSCDGIALDVLVC